MALKAIAFRVRAARNASSTDVTTPVTYVDIRQYISLYVDISRFIAIYVDISRCTPAYVDIRRYTSVYLDSLKRFEKRRWRAFIFGGVIREADIDDVFLGPEEVCARG